MTNEVADYNSRISQGKVSCLIRAYTLDILGSFKSFKSDAICTRLRPLIYAGHLIHIYPTLPFIAEPLKSLLALRHGTQALRAATKSVMLTAML